MFVKGEHKRQFAYEAHTACDKNGFVLDVEVTPGNVHDSVAFDEVYDNVTEKYPEIETVVADSAYKTPHIAKKIFDDGRKREERRLQREKSKEYSLERIIEAINEDPPPMYNPNGIDAMVLWDKSKFENAISDIITNPVVRYKMIIQKLRYGRDEERDIFIKIYSNKMTYDERIQFVLERLYQQFVSEIKIL